MKTFWCLFGIGAVTFLVLGFYLLDGLLDGTVSSYNLNIWLSLVLGPAAVLGGGLLLRGLGRPRLANGVLALLAVPSVVVGAFLLFMIATFVIHPGSHH